MTLSENPLGCSPRALQAAKRLTMQDIADYPDQTVIRTAAANRFAVSEQNVCIGTGSEQLIKLLAQTFLTTGDTALIQKDTFSLFTKECLLAGARVSSIDTQNLKQSDKKPGIVFLCSPNNPTGEPIPEVALQQIITLFPNAVIVIDEANAEFSEMTAIPQAIARQNLLVLRTCSKALGLAGLRIGFCIGGKRLISKLRQSQQAFPVAAPSLKIGVAALEDVQFLQKTLRFIKIERIQMSNALRTMGFSVSNSITNTLFVTNPNAAAIISQLEILGVSVIANSFFPGCTTPGFRIALRDRKTNGKFLIALDQALAISLHHHPRH